MWKRSTSKCINEIMTEEKIHDFVTIAVPTAQPSLLSISVCPIAFVKVYFSSSLPVSHAVLPSPSISLSVCLCLSHFFSPNPSTRRLTRRLLNRKVNSHRNGFRLSSSASQGRKPKEAAVESSSQKNADHCRGDIRNLWWQSKYVV